MTTYASVTETILQVGAWLKSVIANTATVPISGTITVDTSLLATQASLAALVTANHTDLASILTRANLLAADTSITTGNGSLASIKTDLDSLLTVVATAAKQDTGNTALAALHTDLAALIAANHTDEAALATALAILHADSAAILAKQPTSPALESGHLATIDSGIASILALQPAAPALEGGNLAAILTQITAAAASLVSLVSYFAPVSVLKFASVSLTTGSQAKTGAGSWFQTFFVNSSAVPVWPAFFDLATGAAAPTTGTVPDHITAASVAAGAQTFVALPASASIIPGGRTFINGWVMYPSTTAILYTAPVVTTFTGTHYYR